MLLKVQDICVDLNLISFPLTAKNKINVSILGV